MTETAAMVQLLSPTGELQKNDASAPYLPLVEALSDDQLRQFHRHMALMRRIDGEMAALQRQGQMALWVPSHGQEGAQVGSAFAARPQDHIFPAYREHVVGMVRGLDPFQIVRVLRGISHGGWNPAEHGNFHLYTLVIASQTLHATGYAMGIGLDGASGTGDPERDEAVLAFLGDGAMSQGDANEALVFAASYQTPQVFLLQNNHWAISVPVSVQSRVPLVNRAGGFGIPGVQVDGNDVLASYAVSRASLDAARSGEGPRFIEALTYRIGAHTTSDDPTKYRADAELQSWIAKDPIDRFSAYLRGRGESEQFFADVSAEADDRAADLRRRVLDSGAPPATSMFEHVYSEPHPVTSAQREWFERYEASFGGEA